MVKVNYVKNENQELVTNPYRLVDLIKCCERDYPFVVLTTKHEIDPNVKGDDGNDPILAVYLDNNSHPLYLNHCINCGAQTQFEEIIDKLQYIKNNMKEFEEHLRKDCNNEVINDIVYKLNQILLFASQDSLPWFKEALDDYYNTIDILMKRLGIIDL